MTRLVHGRRRPRSALAAWLFLALFFGCGNDRARPPEETSPVDQTTEPAPATTGRWHPSPPEDPRFTAEQREALARLETLPYLAGSRPAPSRTGVTRLVRGRISPGLNLYNSGHAPEAFLIDSNGKVLHRWSHSAERIWPEAPDVHQRGYWRRVTWLPDGDVLAVFEGIGLIRLDKESRLEWALEGAFHHQAVVDGTGALWTLKRKHQIVERIDAEQPIHEDFLVKLSPEGELLEEISILEAFENSPYRALLKMMKTEGDVFHTNSIQVLDGSFAARAAWLREGNLLLSILFLDTICVLDPEKGSVVWALRGDGSPAFHGQHDPRLLESGSLLLFDNWGRSGRSQVIEFDPLTLKTAWRYPRESESDFETPTCGTAQRLANGNTLITESDRGRAFEVTPEGETVWEFFNPHRAGPKGELIATLFEVRRVPDGYFPWR